MPNYRRPNISGATYFLTQVTYQREPWLCRDISRQALREAIQTVRKKYPFSIDAFILLPNHFHCLWTLPPDDHDFSVRLRLIKTYVTKHYREQLTLENPISQSRQKRGEKNLWQRRFWDHLIRDEQDFMVHCDYIHYNPVKHRLCINPQDWQFSSIHRLIEQGVYPPNWGVDVTLDIQSSDLYDS
ncbi:transposase [Dolichospermum sp. ST_con]|nr:transposase [Dolichospermum sp. ST_con]MDD1422305.1 transposase [Dolichospermum sp. ST_sed1]MDD1426993.1 transposase [Dolichospermum sp. ST_sed9]MDD1434536.1 transposase [Dolichospermum sp. ST_sed6]MDD1438151.1 transposase [Dolichospermum sp. ST_sed10]MDD1440910.1 transposase [Dolichospermum sp. ST_sed3]MDD1449351.1 transposase [Dolichospermum sp. ST_sed8]MDD1457163.1 transposase [Dolichospermum sp. ST_sed7]MDD1463244.1 transposase [Dolichospermum sp. ST_sed2]MDD1469458.1 transposase [D